MDIDELRSDLNRSIKADKANQDLTGIFGRLQNDNERVKFTLALMESYNKIPDVVPKGKNSEESIKLREQGNRIFIGGWDHRAIEKYNESIAFASNMSEELGLAYANRSAALFRVQKYQECMQDIDRALSLNYPDKLKTKLFERKGLCLTALGQSQAEECFKDALVWLDNMSLSEEKKDRLKTHLKTLISAPCAIVEVQLDEEEYPLPELINVNSEVPCASDAVAIKYTEELGRHLVATRKIYPGEVVAVEEPYSLILMPENAYTHCWHCLRVAWAMIPCSHCVNVMYCSEECKTIAWEKYHEVECPVVGHLLDLKFNMLGLFSLKLAVLATRKGKNIQALRSELEKIDDCKDPRTKGFCDDGKLHSNEYRSIYSLVTNVDKRSVADLFERAFKAAYILCVLVTQSEMFGTRLEMDREILVENKVFDDVCFVGGLILRHQQMIPSNIHFFGELRGLESFERGAAAMPFYSLINHSCDPNVTRQSCSKHIVMHALYPIEKGEQIFDNYGLHYALTSKTGRQQKLLRQFHFNCECLPCKQDWPLYHRIPTYQAQNLSQQTKNKLEKVLRKHNRYIELATVGDLSSEPNMLNNLLKMIELLFERVRKPCIELNNVVETVKHIYALKGNRFEVPDASYQKKS